MRGDQQVKHAHKHEGDGANLSAQVEEQLRQGLDLLDRERAQVGAAAKDNQRGDLKEGAEAARDRSERSTPVPMVGLMHAELCVCEVIDERR
jgi:hypothetical protein